MKRRKMALFVGFLICLVISGERFAPAQETFGTILGSVTDASGAAVSDAKITVTNTGTGIVRSFNTDATGNYSIFNLPPGTYSLTVHKEGYKLQNSHANRYCPRG